MKLLKYFAGWLFALVFIWSMPGTATLIFAQTPVSKIAITDFASMAPLTVYTDQVVSIEQTQIWLLGQFPTVGVNENTGTVSVSSWELDADSGLRFEAKESGGYVFTAVLETSAQYDTENVTLPLPVVAVMLMPASPHIPSIYSFDPLEDIEIPVEQAEALGFATTAQAQTTLLEQCGSVFVNDGEFSVEISAWMSMNDTVLDSTKAGEYIFVGDLAAPDSYSVECDKLPQVKVVFTKTEKVLIQSFAEFSPVSISSANPTGYRTEEEAIRTLNSLYTSAKVNGGTDVIPLSGWRRTGTAAYDTTQGGTYTFTADLGQSEKYDTANAMCAPPVVRVVFCAPDSYVSVQVTDENDKPVRLASISLTNEETTLYTFTNFQGKSIFYNVAGGEYSMLLIDGDLEYIRPITVRSGYSSVLTWKVSSGKTVVSSGEDFDLSETTTTKATTVKTTATSAQSIATGAEILAEELQKALASGDASLVVLLDSTAESGVRLRIRPGEMSEEQRTAIQSMTVSALAGEIKKAITAVARMNLSGCGVKARDAALKAASGTDAMILPIHFSSHLDFAFPLTITLDTLEEDLGYDEGMCYLYYYNSSSGVLEDCQNATTNGKGAFTFTISHCSDYFLLNRPLGAKTDMVQTATELSSVSSEEPLQVSVVISQGPAGNKMQRPDEPTLILIEEKKSASFSYTPLVLAGGFALILIVSMIIRRRNLSGKE